MAKPDGKGGGNGGGGGDDGGTTTSFTGTNGDDTYTVPDFTTLTTGTFDGRKGSDTLDLSNLEKGVTLKFNNGPGRESVLWHEFEWTGIMYSHILKDEPYIRGSIKNFENIVGTSFIDKLVIDDPGANWIDGGAGNDSITGIGGNDILIGGTGEDWILSYHSNNVYVGGEWGRDYAIMPTGDGEKDVFIISQTGAILDFEVGTDELMLEITQEELASFNPTWTDGYWTDANGDDHPAAVLTGAGKTVYLVGVTAADAASIVIGFATGNSSSGSPVVGGEGDDVFWGYSGQDTFVVGEGSGHDYVVDFDTSEDVLHFTSGAPASWTEVDVNGQIGLQALSSEGQPIVTLLGLSMTDLQHVTIDVGTSSTTSLLGSTETSSVTMDYHLA